MADPITQGGTTEATTVSEAAAEATASQTALDTAPEAGTTVEAASEVSDDSFFDPRDLPAELVPAYKNMQAAFTKKMQGAREHRNKVEAYDSFMANPMGSIQQLASQYGMTLQQAATATQQAGDDEWNPTSWDDVMSRATDLARQSVLAELAPALSDMREVKKTHIEQVLDDEVPDWRQYEDEMIEAIQQHPTLANDPAKLARMVLPESLVEQRAYQRALKKLEAKGNAAKVSSGSNTTKAPDLSSFGKGKMAFQDAVEQAREYLEKTGTLYRKAS